MSTDKAKADPQAPPERVDRVRVIQEAARAALAAGNGYSRRVSGDKEVRIQDVLCFPDAEVPYVEIFLAGQSTTQAPAFRIFNPPTLVADPSGPEVVGGQRYRLDPMATLARIVADNGGALRPAQKGRNR